MRFDRHYDRVFIIEDGITILWQHCVIAGCTNLTCDGLSDVLCYQHGIHYGTFTQQQFDEMRS